VAWAPSYVTTVEMRAYLRILDTVDDAQIAVAVTTASRAVDKAAGRQFGAVDAAVTWTYTAQWIRPRGVWLVPVDDVATTTGMVVVVDGVTVTDYTLWPRQAVAKGKVWTCIVLGPTVTCTGAESGVEVTALWGWPTVPVAVKQATQLQASRFLARRDSPYGVAGSPADGSELRLLATVDPDVRVALGDYTRKWAVA